MVFLFIKREWVNTDTTEGSWWYCKINIKLYIRLYN
jgi:hypothetical protein